MAYTTINKSSDYFNTKLYTGNSSTNAVTGVGFQPDFVWLKPRNLADNHRLMNAVSGADKYLISNSNSGEGDPGSNFASFDSDGFTLGGSDNGWNNSSYNYVTWNWKANGSGSANTDGSISSTVSANTTSGFSIVKWTGTGSNATVGHGLGVAPKMIMVKNLATSDSWNVYHTSLGNAKRIFLDTSGGESSTSDAWNSTSPTTSVFSVGTNTGTNNSGSDLIAYCFAEKKGFSKFGSYTGTDNVDSPFLYCGFKPAFFLVKNYTSGTGESWSMYDNKRLGYNPAHNRLIPNTTAAESTETKLDFVSNGIKIRSAGDGHLNQNTKTYIWMAFAEAPLVGSNNVPCVAR